MADIKEPRESTIRKLFALSLNHCAFPGCTTPIIDGATGTILAEICHIRAQNPSGPRFSASQTAEERHSFNNLVLMCEVHHKIIDAKENFATYSVERLMEIKAAHEEKGRCGQDLLPALADSAVRALLDTIAQYVPPSVFVDFRGATLKAGGDGGYFGGGGGDGGVIHVTGFSTAAFSDKQVDVAGKPGVGFGSGGGGGGVVVVSGRDAADADIADGLRISSCFAANSVEIPNGLFYVQGGGWAFCSLKEVPSPMNVPLLCVVETGQIAANTRLKFIATASDPTGNIIVKYPFEYETAEAMIPVMRGSIVANLSFTVSATGVWLFRICSGAFELARHPLEFRIVP